MPCMKSTSLASDSQSESSCTVQLERARRDLPYTEIQKPNSHAQSEAEESKHDNKKNR